MAAAAVVSARSVAPASAVQISRNGQSNHGEIEYSMGTPLSTQSLIKLSTQSTTQSMAENPKIEYSMGTRNDQELSTQSRGGLSTQSDEKNPRIEYSIDSSDSSKLSIQSVPEKSQIEYSMEEGLEQASPEKRKREKKQRVKELESNASSKVVDLKAYRYISSTQSKAKLSTQSKSKKEIFTWKDWKESRVKPGWLIRRQPGYDLIEYEYGIQYLKVLSRKTKPYTSTDCNIYPRAGSFNWETAIDNGLLVKEKLHEQPKQRAAAR